MDCEGSRMTAYFLLSRDDLFDLREVADRLERESRWFDRNKSGFLDVRAHELAESLGAMADRWELSQQPSTAAGDFCEICGVLKADHPKLPPGPPPNPHEDDLRNPGFHDFVSSKFTIAELLDERDAQINLWQRRAYEAERKLEAVRATFGPPSKTETDS